MRKSYQFIIFLLAMLLAACGTENASVSEAVEENDDALISTELEEEEIVNEQEEQLETVIQDNEEIKTRDSLEELKVHYLDVGQAESTLIQYSSGTDDYHILYDTGDWRGNEVVTYLSQEKIDFIDLIIISHPDADHIGQLEQVLNAVSVGEVWLSGNESSSQTFSDAIEALTNSDADYYEPRAGEIFDIGPLKIEIVYPFDISNKANEESISALMTYGNIRFLFTGDADRSGETEMMENFTVDADILSLGHHGSNTSSSPAFIDAVSPSIAIYSAGIDNSYGHPHPEVVELIKSRGIELYGTDQDGTIVVTTDGNTFEVETFGGQVLIQVEPEQSNNACININEASLEELQQIIHIGPERAPVLINLRPFDTVDDLTRIKGIGKSRLADIKTEGKACVE